LLNDDGCLLNSVGVGGTEPTMASLVTALDEDEELDCSLGEVCVPFEGGLVFYLGKGR
jgi:hypothetical protein